MKITYKLVSIGIAFLARIFQAFVLTKIWLWFFVPSFGLPVLPLSVAIGMCFFFSLLKYTKWYSLKEIDEMFKEHKEREKAKEEKEENTIPLHYEFVNPLIVISYSISVLFISWVFHFMF